MTRIFSTKERGGFTSNLVYAIFAQGVGLLTGMLTSLVLPKFLGVDDYAYWQIFLLYTSYYGFALLGLNDGIYLRLGGKRYSELSHGELKAQECVVVLLQAVVALCCLATVAVAGFEPYRALVLSLCVLYGFLINLTSYIRYVFQCTNLTRISSMADFVAKGLFLVFVVTVLFAGIEGSLPFILGYIGCQSAAFLYVLVCARETLSTKANFTGAVRNCVSDARAGIKIMMAFYADSFIVGFTRMLTDWHLGLVAFGKLSLSFSLTNFVLNFIGQVSMVAFPMLKRLDPARQAEMYSTIRLLLHTMLPMTYLLYVPAKIILSLWLPDYGESFVYFALTMPLCMYSCKASLLFNTYMKMDRNEGNLCAINVAAMLVNGVLTCASILGMESIELATCGIVITVMLRDLVCEWFMARKFGKPFLGFCTTEALLTVGFMAVSWFMGVWSLPAMISMLGIYLWVDRDGVQLIEMEVKKRLKRL